MLVMVAFAVGSYMMSTSKEYNEVTGEYQRVAFSTEEEIAMGLHAAPRMAAQHGGLLPNQEAQDLVDAVGGRIVTRSAAAEMDYNYEFHLLADDMTVNAFALPGGQIFITTALFKQLKTEDELAGVLGHEVGHVVGRHSAEQVAKSKLSQGLSTAVLLAAGDAGGGSAQLSQMVSKLVNTRYGREDELESDRLGVRFMIEAGYEPRALIRVMEVLKAAASGPRPPEFMSTHPDPGNRVEVIKQEIEKFERGGQ